MSGLLSALQNSAKTLSAQSTAISTAGKNLANVNNSSYARQSVVLGDSGTINTAYGTESMGTEVQSVQSARNTILDSQVLRELMNRGSLDSQQTVNEWLQTALGEQVSSSSDTSTTSSSSSTGLSASISDFYNAFSAWAADPASDTQKNAVLQKAQALVDEFHSVDTRLNSIDSDVVTQIDTDTTSAQSLLKDIAGLNKEIARMELRVPGSALDLRDARESKLEELAKYMNFTTQSTGSLGGIQVIAKDTTGADVTLVDGINVNGTLAYTGTGFTGGNPASTLDLTGGSLNGLQSTRTGSLADMRTSLDNLAAQFVESVNGTSGYNGAFFKTDAVTPTLYKTAGDIALDSTLSVSTLDAGSTTASGDNDRATAVAALAKTNFTATDHIQGTFTSYYSKLVSNVGQDVAAVTQKVANSKLVSNMLSTQRDSVSGVSTDEELTNLMTYQRAFQASARVINIMDSMLETIVTGLGRG